MNIPALTLLVCIPALLAAPCSAGYLLQDVRLDPPGTAFPPGTAIRLSASLPIIPSGPTTFIDGHTLVLSTDLVDPGWDVRVMVDGRQAAVFSNYQNTLFINGYLLSYPVSKDVEIYVGLKGTVPSPAGGVPFTALRVGELNNQGQRVPGSEQSVALVGALVETTPGQGRGLNPPPETTANETASAGFPLVPALVGLILASLLVSRKAG